LVCAVAEKEDTREKHLSTGNLGFRTGNDTKAHPVSIPARQQVFVDVVMKAPIFVDYERGTRQLRRHAERHRYRIDKKHAPRLR